MTFDTAIFDELLNKLSANALDVDAQQSWPKEQFQWLAEAGVLKWFIPEEFGGKELTQVELTEGYEKLAAACLSTCFAFTQRNGACQRIAGSKNEELKADLLPRLATGELFATVGISHLTTSRQHIAKPAVEAEEQSDSFVLNGMIPWVTGATAADIVVTGGTCSDGKQVLLAMPTASAGVSIQPKAELMALTSTETTSIRLENVSVPKRSLLAGPIEKVMNKGKGGGTGSLTTSILALGLSARSLGLLEDEASRRDDLIGKADSFKHEVDVLRSEIHTASLGKTFGDEGLSPTAIRQQANSLALRITQTVLAVTKGAGFMVGHPAELAVREAMFFLVWSCPQPVVEGVLNELSCRDTF